MGHIFKYSHGGYGGASLKINTTDDAAADNGIEVDDSESGDHVEKLRLDLRQFLSLHLDVWCEDQDVDVILQYLRGYTADGDEVWADVGTETALTAATNSDAVADVLAVMSELYSDSIRPGVYRVAAQRAGATAAGRLHIFGHAKG